MFTILEVDKVLYAFLCFFRSLHSANLPREFPPEILSRLKFLMGEVHKCMVIKKHNTCTNRTTIGYRAFEHCKAYL